MPNLEQIKRELKKYNFAYEENVLPVRTNGGSSSMGRCVVAQGEKEFAF